MMQKAQGILVKSQKMTNEFVDVINALTKK